MPDFVVLDLPPTVHITRRRTSRLSMRIAKNGDVRVSVPLHTPDEEVQQFILRHRDWIEQARQRAAANRQTRQAFYDQLPLKTRAQWNEARQRLDVIVRPLLQRHAKEMGVQPAIVYYRATISRWGSCHTARRALCFSLYLLLLPEWCIEHTVIHELAHLLVPNHSPRFYAVMDRHFPRWKEAREEVRRIVKGC